MGGVHGGPEVWSARLQETKRPCGADVMNDRGHVELGSGREALDAELRSDDFIWKP